MHSHQRLTVEPQLDILGIFVGASLLFDGAALAAIGWSLRKR